MLAQATAIGTRMETTEQATLTVTINYGYDLHNIVISKEDYQAFIDGQTRSVTGQGFFHEEYGEQVDYWLFNGKTGQISFSLENGAEFFSEEGWVSEN